MGNMTMDATILVKCWEPTLQEFVLIRRPARFPVFGNLLDAYMVDERLDVYVDMSEDISNYQTNLNYLYEIGLEEVDILDKDKKALEGEGPGGSVSPGVIEKDTTIIEDKNKR
jgi:hypothetical protein